LQGKDGAMRQQGWYRLTSTVRGMSLFDDVLVTSSIYLFIKWGGQINSYVVVDTKSAVI